MLAEKQRFGSECEDCGHKFEGHPPECINCGSLVCAVCGQFGDGDDIYTRFGRFCHEECGDDAV